MRDGWTRDSQFDRSYFLSDEDRPEVPPPPRAEGSHTVKEPIKGHGKVF